MGEILMLFYPHSATAPLLKQCCADSTMTTTSWLTIEAAAQAVSIELEILQSYLNDPAPEKRFQPHGLLFDRERWQSDRSDFLQILDPHQDNPDSTSRTQSNSDRAYGWDETPIRLEISWLPIEPNRAERLILISATSHDDFPVSDLIHESELGELPPVLAQLLEELKIELPIRKIRYQQGKGKSKPNANRSSSSAKPSQPNTQTSNKPTETTAQSGLTQVSLF